MNVNTWLKLYAPGFCDLQHDEQLAILHFSLLWSFFEATVLDRCGSVSAIKNATKRWAENDLLTKNSFERHINYFRSRYYVNGEYTYHFDNLNLPNNDSCVSVKKVLQNMDANPNEVAVAILIIVYRIRNNLFHGEKWSYGLRGQLDNFNHANASLIEAIELDSKRS